MEFSISKGNGDEEEKLCFIRAAHSDFDAVGLCLEEHDAYSGGSNFVKMCLLRCAIISYSKPFKGSNPIVKGSGKWSIRIDATSADRNPLFPHHNATLRARDQVVAHGDLSFSKPEVLRMANDPSIVAAIRASTMGYNEYRDLIPGLKLLKAQALEFIISITPKQIAIVSKLPPRGPSFSPVSHQVMPAPPPGQ